MGLAQVFAARNRASREMPARICAGEDRRKEGRYGTASLLSHWKLSDRDRITGGTRRTFETEWRETEGEFVNLCRR